MEEIQTVRHSNTTVIMLDVAVAFVFSFSLVGVLTLDYFHRSTTRLSQQVAAAQVYSSGETDFDPGVSIQGSLDDIPADKLHSLFDNLQ